MTGTKTSTFWEPSLGLLYSKAWSSRLERTLACVESGLPLVREHDRGLAVTTIGEVITRGRELLRLHRTVVIKAAFGLSGRGMIRVTESELETERVTGWITNALRRHRTLLIEPWLPRAFDFSMQYEVQGLGPDEEPQVVFKGGTVLSNDDRGQFQSCTVGQRFLENLPPNIAQFLNAGENNQGWARELYRVAIPGLLERELTGSGFEGPLGIDAFVYEDNEDNASSLRLRPIVEINPRFTIGRVALELGKHLQPGKKGRLQIARPQNMLLDSTIEATVHGSKKKMTSGFLPLTEPAPQTKFAATWHVV